MKPFDKPMDPFEITVPFHRNGWKETIGLFIHLLEDGIMWLARGIAVLSIFHFALTLLNGSAEQSGMGSITLDDPSFRRRTDRYEDLEAPPPRRG